jgi:hypothetical protein
LATENKLALINGPKTFGIEPLTATAGSALGQGLALINNVPTEAGTITEFSCWIASVSGTPTISVGVFSRSSTSVTLRGSLVSLPVSGVGINTWTSELSALPTLNANDTVGIFIPATNFARPDVTAVGVGDLWFFIGTPSGTQTWTYRANGVSGQNLQMQWKIANLGIEVPEARLSSALRAKINGYDSQIASSATAAAFVLSFDAVSARR